jgi:hypothetical protein
VDRAPGLTLTFCKAFHVHRSLSMTQRRSLTVSMTASGSEVPAEVF